MARLERKDVLRITKEKKVRFVRLWFTDILGFLKSLAITVRELEGTLDDLVKQALGDHVFHQFNENKKIEWERYRARVTDYELDQCFSVL